LITPNDGPQQRSLAARLRDRERVIGFWQVLACASISERMAMLGYDYVGVDLQHGLIDDASCLQMVTAIDAGRSAAVVRVPDHNAAKIGWALDIGAAAVLVPMVNTADDAQAIVSAIRYPPRGVRSYGPQRASLRLTADLALLESEVACIVMIETADGLENVNEIAATDGVDAIYVGPSDLAIGLGISPRPRQALAKNPIFLDALARIRAAADASSKASGIHCADAEMAAEYLGQGFTFATTAVDAVSLDTFARDALMALRSG
jgi:4-hydroxy-2-oxoheptanedioate aldolase